MKGDIESNCVLKNPSMPYPAKPEHGSRGLNKPKLQLRWRKNYTIDDVDYTIGAENVR